MEQDPVVIPPARKLTLRRVSTGEIIPVHGERFVLGRAPGLADHVITGNLRISRVHASIIYSNDTYYIQDEGSTNKTKVNGAVIAPYTPIALRHYDTVELDTEQFIILEY